jgi:TolB protein
MARNFVYLTIALAASAAQAQSGPEPGVATPTVIAIPVLATPKTVDTPAGSTWAIANQMADVIAGDLKTTSSFVVADVKSQRIPSYPEVTAPTYSEWQGAGAQALLTGFVEARPDGRLMVGCYVYDVQKQRELARQGFIVVPADWRRAAHKCADVAYSGVTGTGSMFDSRVAYISQSRPVSAPLKRVTVMDLDGTNLTYLTTGETTAITPTWSPKTRRLAYTSFGGGSPHVVVLDLASDKKSSVLPGAISFAPAFAPDGQSLALSVTVNGNTDIYAASPDGSSLRRLTTSPAIDTEPAFSPDGRQIVFSSDRSGSQQLYVMNSDGTGQRRISFGSGEYGAPAWSADGKRIAFTNVTGGSMRIGIMNVDGSDLRLLTSGPYDSQPTWGPSSDHVMFQRKNAATGRTSLFTIAIDRGEPRPVSTPQDASDPSWIAREQ